MRFLYTIGIWFYALGVRVAALFGHSKARAMVRGWRYWRNELARLDARPVVWFHASSLGEFEQARPVLERYLELHPEHQVLLTFFSPSGYEVRKNYPKAQAVCYLPPDLPLSAKRFTKHLTDLRAAFFVKYDFWFNYLAKLRAANIPTYLFSAIFRPGQYFFKPWGRWFVGQIARCYTHIFVQNEESLQLLRSRGVERCSLAGDTRFDRVHQIAASAERDTVVEGWLDGHDGKVMVCGSTWPPDEELIAKVKAESGEWSAERGKLKVIIAPHVISEEHLRQIERLFPDSERYSQRRAESGERRAESGKCDVLIIDNIGLLSKLYRYADVAYIGGGFGAGIHNILEAVTFGKPVLFGPNYGKFKEARDILACGGGFTHSDAASLKRNLEPLLTNADTCCRASEACTAYMKQNIGSTDKILSTIRPGHPSHLSFLIFALSLLLLTACGSVRRYIPEGEHLLYKNQIDVQMADGNATTPEVQEALKFARNYLRQKPNSKVLGIDKLRLGMTIYGWASPQDSSIWGNYLRRLGQAPVVYDEALARRTATQLTGLLTEKGCFSSTVTFDTAAVDGKDLTVCYHIRASQRYIVDEVVYRTDNTDIAKLLRQWEPDALVKAGEPYDQDKLTAERSRIVANLREEGYFHATPDLVTFLVDTTYDNRRLSIDVMVAASGLKVYHINNVYIYPGGMGGKDFDTLIYTYRGIRRDIDYQFIYSEPMPFKPQTISRAMMLFPAMTYRPRYISNTYNSLLSLRNFKYINIEFSESPSSTDSLPLVDAHVRLVRATQQKVSLSAELTNASPLGSDDSTGTTFISGGNLGIEAAVEYQHKNLFGGAEQLKIKYTQLMELPKFIFNGGGGGFYDHFSAFESGLDLSLDMPMFLLPFAGGIAWQRSRPHTSFSLGGSYQYRYYYERILANISFGYNWRSSRRPIQHQLLPVDLTFVRMLSINDAFAARIQDLNDLRLKYQYSNHFIFGTRYDFAYSGQKFGTREDFTVVRLSAESAGNLLAATSSLLGATADSNGVRHILGSPYAQYVRLGGEVTYYHYIFDHSTLVTRLMLGAGLPYGNSVAMPYEKSFFGGGPTTLRAWQLRRLGPGSYNSGATMLERVGDLQLVANIEGRFPIVSILEGAVFADMGNVWLLNASDQYPGGELKWGSILREIAVGVGFGIRLNVSIATLRVDFGIPLYDPGYDSGLRWRPTHWKFNQIVTNFGINYPF